MLSVPVRLYAATESKDLSFNTLHAECGARIKQQRICPVHDQVLEAADTERAYQYARDAYVPISDDDLEQLIVPSRHTIDLRQFIQASELDPAALEKTYWLEPEPLGARAYALLRQALESRQALGIGTLTLRTRERLCALRSADDVLFLDTLYYPDEIRERFIEPAPEVSAAELALAENLVETLTSPFDPAAHTDGYRLALLEMIEARRAGRPLTTAPQPAAPSAPMDLMAQLQAAVVQARTERAS